MTHKPTHNPPAGAGLVQLDGQAFAAALSEIADALREALGGIAEAVRAEVRAELAAFRLELAALLEGIGAEEPEEPAAPVAPGEPAPVPLQPVPVDPVPPALPEVPPVAPPAEEPPTNPGEPGANPGEPSPEAVRREGGPSFDAFEGVEGVAEVFVLTPGDEVRGFVSGEDRLEVPAGAFGRSGEALANFATATGNGDLVEAVVTDGSAVALLFTDEGAAVVQGATPLSAGDWLFV